MSERFVALLPDPEHPVELAAGDGPPVLTVAALKPIDLTQTRGFDVTAERLQEIVNAYDPGIERASLNFDHEWGGPSLGWCDELWIQDGMLWARYTDLAPEAVAGIQERRYIRQSAELVFDHSITHTWYLTGLALLGNLRPEVKSLPEVKFCSRKVFFVKKETSMPPTTEPPPAADPQPQPTPPAETSAELATLRAQVAEGAALTAQLRRDRAELDAERRLSQLGNRLTPAMRKLAQPLVVELLAAAEPASVQLRAEPNAAPAAVHVVDRIFEILAAAPAIEAIGAGRLAEADPPATTSTLSADREAELAAKYGYTTRAFGFRPNSN